MPRTPEWVYTQMLTIELDLEAHLKAIVGAPRHDTMAAAAHAYAFGRLQNVLDVVMREGVAIA